MESKNNPNGERLRNPNNTGRNGSANRNGNSNGQRIGNGSANRKRNSNGRNNSQRGNANGRTPLIPITNPQTPRKNNKNKPIEKTPNRTMARFGADLNLRMRYVPIGMRVVDLKKHRYALVFEIRPGFKSTPARKTSRMISGLGF